MIIQIQADEICDLPSSGDLYEPGADSQAPKSQEFQSSQDDSQQGIVTVYKNKFKSTVQRHIGK